MTVAGEGFGSIGIRIGSALVFGLVVLAAVLFGGVWGLGALCSLATALAAWEMTRLAGAEDRSSAIVASVAGLLVMLATTAGTATVSSSAGVYAGMGALAAMLLLALIWFTVARSSTREGLASIMAAALWIGFGLAHLVLLRGAAVTDTATGSVLPVGKPLVLLTVLGVWAGDVAAYTVGVAIGRHKLAPRLSPNKSWEGFVAGVVATIGVWVGVGTFLEVPLVPVALGVVGAVSAVFGLLGDLAESRMKRLAGVKDSGTLMPGHGGILDRIDSLIVVSVPLFWLAVTAGLA